MQEKREEEFIWVIPDDLDRITAEDLASEGDDTPVISIIRSGGQTGADRGALDAALDHGVPICGKVPKGGWAEDMPEPPGLLADYPELTECEESDISIRTRLNVEESDVTIIVGDDSMSGGTMFTEAHAIANGKPVLVVGGMTSAEVMEWLESAGRGLEVNVAGPRASEAPEAYGQSYSLVSELLEMQEI